MTGSREAPDTPGYVVEGFAGSGAHGTVWRARHVASGRAVAIKHFEARPPLEAEAEAVARLEHVHVVDILDVCRQGDGGLLVMPWADGGTLASSMVADRDVATIGVALLQALAHAHAHDVLHLDVKPSNVLLHASTVWLADFSVSWLGEVDGPVGGSRPYMAPEQRLGRGVGPWTDRYGVGALLHALLTGAPPGEDGPRLEGLGPVGDVVRTLLHPSPWGRFASDAEAADALAAARAGHHAVRPAFEEPTTVFEDADGAAVLPPRGPAPRTPTRWDADLTLVQRLDASRGPEVLRYRLATLPVVGRAEAKARLWAALRRTHEEGGAHLVVLRGPHGAGRRHLALWLRRHAAESGHTAESDSDTRRPRVVVVEEEGAAATGRVLAAMTRTEPRLHVVLALEVPAPLKAVATDVIDVGPLGRDAFHQLVRYHMALDAAAEEELYRTSRGLPGVAVAHHAHGLRERPATRPVARELERALQVASAFRHPPSVQRWVAACEEVGISRPRRLLSGNQDVVRVLGGSVHVLGHRTPTEEVWRALWTSEVGEADDRGRWALELGELEQGVALLLDAFDRRHNYVPPADQGLLERVLEVSQGEQHVRARLLVAWGHVVRNRLESARPHIEWLETHAADEPMLEVVHARAETLSRRPEEGLARLRRDLNGVTRLRGHVARAYALGALSRYDEVIDVFGEGVHDARAQGLIHWELGMWIDRTGWGIRAWRPMLQEAREAYRVASEQPPDLLHGTVLTNLAVHTWLSGAKEEAETLALQAEEHLDRWGAFAAAFPRLWRLRWRAQRGEDARLGLAALKRVFATFPQGHAPWLHAVAAEALVHGRMQNPAGLRASLDELLEACARRPEHLSREVTSLLPDLLALELDPTRARRLHDCLPDGAAALL